MFGLDLSFLSWEIISKFVVQGFYFSLQLTVIATIGGIVLGTLLALMRLSGKAFLTVPATIYVNGMRSVPLVMVILWFFLLVPSGFYNIIPGGSNHRAEISAIVTFIAFEAAYFSEIMRAGIQSISGGQVNAGVSKHGAYLAHANHHLVSRHVLGLCHWCLRHAQGL
jgi:glutamate/aspartate transport system permease protein